MNLEPVNEVVLAALETNSLFVPELQVLYLKI